MHPALKHYPSFSTPQDKLHQNLCRQRSLVAIGTHDLATIQGPFSYEALPPEDIRFVPLKQTQEFDARSLLQVSSPGSDRCWRSAVSS
jgi:phenylalanyl-tRNA synthetase beta chain